MIFRLSNLFKLLTITILCSVVYIEYISYFINTIAWARLSCDNPKTCIKVLLVADPQLIGEDNEILHFATPFSIWDSDRYLSKTYFWAAHHIKPDVVIFLGDLFDEGIRSTVQQFHRYSKRFFNIFDTTYPIQHIWLPGDNDIGGETEPVSDEKLRLFNNTFRQDFYLNVKFVTFTKVNRMERMFKNEKDKQNISVVASHMPLILIPSLLVDKLLNVMNPKIIFSAHEHRSILVQTNKYQTFRNLTMLSGNRVYNFPLNIDMIHEIIVPTCSYRMGSPDVGYGAAIIDQSGFMNYTVLWSPYRFNYLYAYLCVLIFVLSIILCIIFRICHKNKQKTVSKYGNFYYRYKILKNGV